MVRLEKHLADFEARERLAKALQPRIEEGTLRGYARSLKVSSNTVFKWLNCESFPSGKNVSKVAQSLGMSLDEFSARIIEGKNTGTPDPVDQAISIIRSLPPASLARVQRAIADRIESFSERRPLTFHAAEPEEDHAAHSSPQS